MRIYNKSIELEYYIKQGISPVHYKIKNLNKHFEIRSSLYQLLGLAPSLINGKDVLEVAPGSGHNSIFTSSLLPKSYDLVEPNPKGCKDILTIFKSFKKKHTKPNLYQLQLSKFNKKKKFDVVITEGWPGGFLSFDRKMLKKISSFVKPGGLLLISFFPAIGAMSTYLRRLIAYRLISNNLSFQKKTKILENAFSNHLNNLKSMGRSKKHWIQDSILNPYICVAHNSPKVCNTIFKDNFEIYNSIPKFSNEWRWYKSLYGKNKKFNKQFISEYEKVNHCLIDYRMKGFIRSQKKNIKLEKMCNDFAQLTKDNEKCGQKIYIKKIEPLLEKIIKNIKSEFPKIVINSLQEANNLLKKKSFNHKDVAKMKFFSSLFGREQCYLSFINSQKI